MLEGGGWNCNDDGVVVFSESKKTAAKSAGAELPVAVGIARGKRVS